MNDVDANDANKKVNDVSKISDNAINDKARKTIDHENLGKKAGADILTSCIEIMAKMLKNNSVTRSRMTIPKNLPIMYWGLEIGRDRTM
jgi:hypothetical protein